MTILAFGAQSKVARFYTDPSSEAIPQIVNSESACKISSCKRFASFWRIQSHTLGENPRTNRFEMAFEFYVLQDSVDSQWLTLVCSGRKMLHFVAEGCFGTVI